MKLAPWIVAGLLAVFATVLIAVFLTQRTDAQRPAFVALPLSVALDKSEAPAPPSTDPLLAGLTADDVVRGLLALAEADTGGLTAEQAAALQPIAAPLRTDRHRLLTLRQGRHETNEAAMENTLAVGVVLSNAQLAAILGLPREGAVTEEDWQSLNEKLRANR
jgi:hypothetical protein